MQNFPKSIILALLCTATVSVAQIFLKIGSETFSLSLNQIFNYYLWAGGILYVFGMFLFIWAFRVGELSIVYPIMASGFIIVTLLSIYVLGEFITPQKWLGLFLITLGVVFVGRGGSK